jgi:hypothetical protein
MFLCHGQFRGIKLTKRRLLALVLSKRPFLKQSVIQNLKKKRWPNITDTHINSDTTPGKAVWFSAKIPTVKYPK